MRVEVEVELPISLEEVVFGERPSGCLGSVGER
jgi:hypothetical protein